MDQEQFRQVYEQYFYYILIGGVVVGLLFGLIPLIFALKRKKKNFGIVAFFVSGILGGFSPLVALVAAIIFLILILKTSIGSGKNASIDQSNQDS